MNNIFKKTVNEILERKTRLENGGINSIPFPFPALNDYVPGIFPESQIGLTTVSGGGKTLFSTNIYVQHPFNFWYKHKDSMDIDLKIFLFCLEDSVSLTMKRLIIRALWEQKGIRLPMFKLNSYFTDNKMDDEMARNIESLEGYFDTFLSKVQLEEISNPTGIYKTVEKWMLAPENGYIVDAKGKKLNDEEIKEARSNYQETFYKPTNPNRFVIVVIDNMQNITPEKGSSKWEALDLLCRSYLRNKLCNYFKCTNLIIAQQEKSKEKAQYTNTGGLIEEKFMPSLDSIAEYKNVTDTCHVMFGLFNPYRYRIEEFAVANGVYNLSRLKDYYRNLHILKSNFVETNLNTSLFFDGVTGTIQELPGPDKHLEMEKFYKEAERLAREKYVKSLKI